MKNILKLSLVLCLLSAGVQSCTEANAKHHHDEAAKCIGSKPCKACKNCKYCKHCNSGGKCGVCSR